MAEDAAPVFILRTSSAHNYAGNVRHILKDGKPVMTDNDEFLVERLPQIGHFDDDLRNPKVDPRIRRYETVVTHAGNVVSMVVTCAASELRPDAGFIEGVRLQQRMLGWFKASDCPANIVQHGDGALSEHQVRAKHLLTDDPCKRGTYGEGNYCPHTKAEIAARVARNNKIESDRDRKNQNEADKHMGNMQRVNNEMVEKLVGGMAAAQAQSNAELVRALKETDDTKPVKAKESK